MKKFMCLRNSFILTLAYLLFTNFYKCLLTIFIQILYFFLLICTIGKSYLLKAIANCTLERGLNVSVSAPTRKLSSTYTHELPSCRCYTVHANYFIPVDNSNNNTINWSLSDIHVLLVDEVICIQCLFAVLQYLLFF